MKKAAIRHDRFLQIAGRRCSRSFPSHSGMGGGGGGCGDEGGGGGAKNIQHRITFKRPQHSVLPGAKVFRVVKG